MNSLPGGYKPSPDLLKDKVIVVTGAGSGIGRSAALSFASHGATVVLLGRTTQKLEAVYDEIEANGGPQPAIYPINFEGACEKDYEDMAQALFDEFGRLDGLLHNAAELGQRTPLNNYSTDVWLQVMQVNVNAPFMLTKSMLPLLERAEQASILFTGSSVGLQGRAYWGAYAASKAALENLMQTLAQELDGTCAVRANSVNPGATRTTMRATAYPAENPATVKSAEELMPLYLYLIGPDSNGVSGQQFGFK
ncbi:MAG: YciK family oxidoreductase [Gammaproteobacteria bacterium]|uniref:YciK family oxidoreductase n=1 Tax=Pseudomaricurvus alcaniphilus TaxID=1166482 RepID=UPI001408946C|nr:YciK family oxidoreductase [Pseudomaricurvus alcaniphilus]MBR9910105.1 YciK family oxidoreductase [Gammaproteobacteria bacterium]NHN36621.1 YciK family oxidoreductase [Pseudomaricurvus alcaniphilus]